MELVHAHIAKQPIPPHELKPEIPKMVSQIVMKLMAKEVSQRYQSTRGLMADLQHCLAHKEELNQLSWVLGEADLADRLVFPERLYGREVEIEQLEQMFARAKKGTSELGLIAGSAGVGKS